MNAHALRLLLALGAVPSPDPQPESLEPKPPWRGDPQPKPTPKPGRNLCGGTGELYDPLAYDGFNGDCPGCDGCRDVEPPPEPTPPPLTPDGWDRAALAEPFPPPQIDHVRGRVVSVAKGPNRKQRRAR